MLRAVAAGLLVVSTAGLATAQLTGDCTTAILNVANNRDAAACLSVSSLVPLLSGDVPIVGPVSGWIDHVCPAPACSDDTLEAITANVTSGCATELNTFGISPDAASAIARVVQSVYPTLREVLCLSDGDANCVVQTLTNVQDMYGDLTPVNIYRILTSDDVTLPSNITCTDCTKGFYSTLAPNIALVNEDDAQARCGDDFTDHSMPSGIKQSASSEIATSAGGSNDAQSVMNLTRIGSLIAASLALASASAFLS
ncbi:hypothetical protein HDZ31DRAFT_84555 [Schizophyllum fasciatum]